MYPDGLLPVLEEFEGVGEVSKGEKIDDEGGQEIIHENDIIMGDGKVAHLRNNGDSSDDDSPLAKRVK